MLKRFVVAILLIHVFHIGNCQLPQFSLQWQAINKINKENWAKAEQLLQKSLRKEVVNPEAKYVLAQLFLLPNYPKFNIDSSHRYVVESMRDFDRLTAREKERLKPFSLDSVALSQLKKQIDSTAFARAEHQHTESGYTYFLAQFGDAEQKKQAIERRNEVAYAAAMRGNSFKSFEDYLKKYPNSFQATEAKRRYEKLWFEDQTKDDKLTSYVSFLKRHPDTKYKRELEKNIFEIATAAGEPRVFKEFLIDFPESNFKKRATDILYYLSEESAFMNDSLKNISALNKTYWIPILKDDKFGFMDQNGLEVVIPQFENIDNGYICSPILTDFLLTSSGVVGRNGKLIVNTEAEAIEDLGLGFVKVKSKTCWRLAHKSGFNVGNVCLQDAKIIASRFLATKEGGKWTLLTFAGRALGSSSFDDIYAEDDIVVFMRAGKKFLKTVKEVAELADNNPWKETIIYDGIKALGQGRYLVNNGSLQGVLSSSLNFIVPLDRQSISQTPYGFMRSKNNKLRLTGVSNEIDSKDFVSIDFFYDWIKLKDKNDLILYDGKNKNQIEANLDSVWFKNKMAFAMKGDSLTVYFNLSKSLSFEGTSEINFMKAIDGVQYFWASDAKKKTIVDVASGKKIFSVKANSVEYLGQGVFLIVDENKKGLVNKNGKMLLPIEYNEIVASRKNFVSLLKDKKFGLYDLSRRILIKPAYERNIIPYSPEKLVAYKSGFYGIVSWALKEESKFEFEEIEFWNDSVAMVKKDALWMLYAINQKKILANKIKDFRLTLNTDEEKIAIVHQGSYYGVISNVKGTVIASVYNDIVTLGTPENPIYFTEKFIEEADIHVVIYFNAAGKVLRKQAYEAKEYERIYCDN